MGIVEEYENDQRKHYIHPMQASLREVNSESGKEIHFHPGCTPALRSASNLYVAYKLRESGATDRTLVLLIHESEYTMNARERWSFCPESAEHIKAEIHSFWGDANGEQTRTIYIP